MLQLAEQGLSMRFGDFHPMDAATQTHPDSGARSWGCLGLQPQPWGVCMGVLRCPWAGENQGKATAL